MAWSLAWVGIPPVCLVLMMSAAHSQPALTEPPVPPTNTWIATEIRNQDVDPSVTTTFEIHPDWTISGMAGCNRYTGRILMAPEHGPDADTDPDADLADADTITISDISVTRKICPPRVMVQEDSFLETLALIKDWHHSQGSLSLIDSRGETMIRLRTHSPVTKRDWHPGHPGPVGRDAAPRHQPG